MRSSERQSDQLFVGQRGTLQCSRFDFQSAATSLLHTQIFVIVEVLNWSINIRRCVGARNRIPMADKGKSNTGGVNVKKARNKNEEKKNKGDDVTTNSARKNKKFVNLYSEDGKERETVLLTGRHPCNCLASRWATHQSGSAANFNEKSCLVTDMIVILIMRWARWIAESNGP